MSLTIDLPQELETRLEQAAARNGVSKPDFVRAMLEQTLRPQPERRQFPFTAKIVATNLPVRDRSREQQWLEQHRAEYIGRYVALHGDQLVAVGDGAKEVADVARAQGITDALIVFVEEHDATTISGGLW
jgi:plasmid stability protein